MEMVTDVADMERDKDGVNQEQLVEVYGQDNKCGDGREDGTNAVDMPDLEIKHLGFNDRGGFEMHKKITGVKEGHAYEIDNSLHDTKLIIEDKIETEDEDEDDVDFNPFLRRSPSPEGSSGLSSENEDDEDGAREGECLESVEERFQVRETAYYEENTFLELGSENEEEDEGEGNEEEGYNNDEGKEGFEVRGGQTVEVELFSGNNPENQAEVALQGFNGSIEEDADIDTGFEDRNISDEERKRHTCTSEGILNDSIQERMEEELICRTFASLSDLKSPGKEKLTFETDRVHGREEEEEVVDAICKRTRAHLSLADMSLDELETFLQESDEEDYFQNVDDEEEYRKFLAAVKGKLEGDAGQSEEGAGKEDEEDEDEEDDYDFEIEIEEALESDYEETLKGEARKRKRRGTGHRPETREKRRRRSRPQNKERPLGLAKFPLRPLLPSVGNAFATGREKIMLDRLSKVQSSDMRRKPPMCGFTAHQIGQLYCLIHEHVQLLVQVFSLCILEPSRQQIAIETHKLLMELVDKREQVLSWKRTAFPEFCFHPPYTHPSVSDETSYKPMVHDIHSYHFNETPAACKATDSSHPFASCQPVIQQSFGGVPFQVSFPSAAPLGVQGQTINSTATQAPTSCNNTSVFPSSTPMQSVYVPTPIPAWRPAPWALQANASYPQSCSSSGAALDSQCTHTVPSPMFHTSVQSSQILETCNSSSGASAPHLSNAHIGQGKSTWAPVISGPVCSIWDVTPLAFVREFLVDIARVVQEYRQRHVESGAYHSSCEREPLFPLLAPDHDTKDMKKPNKGTGPTSQFGLAATVGANLEQLALNASQPQIKKTMAAALVENTKKQCLALVPKDIIVVIRRFFPIFNAALFPHKPPPAATANRLLFTDAEDELLAMGLMTYNTDWKAIQQRFLPSKTMHQIFVRQKNRSSGRAPENTIKAVRRMKASPLTLEEKSCIEEGLKLFKFDWTKIWQHCVPHRDPAVLPRQWRLALGAQKSFKHSEATKEKRRIYEASRQRLKNTKNEITSLPETAEDTAPTTQDYDDGEVNSGDEDDGGDTNEAYLHEAFLADWKPHASHFMAATGPLPSGTVQGSSMFSSTSSGEQRRPAENSSLPRKQVSTPHIQPGFQAFSGYFTRSPVEFRPYHYRRRNGFQTVKLAPGLPSLDLPPTVRVISQSNLVKTCHLQPTKVDGLISQQKSIVNAQGSHSPQQDARVGTFSGSKCSVLASSRNTSNSEVVSHASFSPHFLPAENTVVKRKDRKDIAIASKKQANSNRADISNQQILSSSQVALDNTQTSSSQEHIVSESSRPPQEAEIQMHPLFMQQSFESPAGLTTAPDVMLNGKFSFNDSGAAVSTDQQWQSFLLQQIPQFHPFFGAPKGNNNVGTHQLAFRSGTHQLAFRPAPVRPSQIFAIGTSELHPLLLEDRGKLCSRFQVKNAGYQHSGGGHLTSFPDCPTETSGPVLQPYTESHTILRPEPERISQQRPLKQIKFGGMGVDESCVRVTSDQVGTVDEAAIGRKNISAEENELLSQETGLENEKMVCNSKQNSGLVVPKHKKADDGTGTKKVKLAKPTCRRGTQRCPSTACIPDSKSRQTRSKSKVSCINTGKSNNSKLRSELFDLGREDINANIVMEQEELSDSDEEIEVVQFEYEEMGDSDREGFENEQLFSEPEREDDGIEFEEEEICSDDGDDEQGGTNWPGAQHCSNQAPQEFSAPVTVVTNGQMGGHCRRGGLRSPSGISKYRRPCMDIGKQRESLRGSAEKGKEINLRLEIGRDRKMFQPVESENTSYWTDARQEQDQAAPADKELGGRESDICSAAGSRTMEQPVSCLIYDGTEDARMVAPEQVGDPFGSHVTQTTGTHLDMATAELGNECSSGSTIQEPDKIALEAAQVLTVIHQKPGEKNKLQNGH